jgi:hypothetical protein
MTPESCICVRCGAWYPAQPETCLICTDEREAVPTGGQQWTRPIALQVHHRNVVRELEPGLSSIVTSPAFAIAQQMHLVETAAGNLLWNSNSLVDDDARHFLRDRGVAAMAVCHPHFYTGMAAWSAALSDIPIFIHADDQAWVTDPSPNIVVWEGETCRPFPGSGLTLIRCGGHFPGSHVLHWPDGAGGLSVLLTGDTISVAEDRRWVTFMYSYPNWIPLGPQAIARILAAIAPYPFSRLYGGWPGAVVAEDASAAIHRSAERFLAHVAR